MAKIKALKAREILDSRGHPTIETTVYLDSGHSGTTSVPSGESTGKYEALELRDNDPQRFNGLGVLKAINNVNTVINNAIKGMESSQQTQLDQKLINLDGTNNKSKLGSNAILSVSVANIKASASSYNLPVYKYLQQKYSLIKKITRLPNPTFNIINGGAHGAGNLDFQEFHIIPSLRYSYSEALEIGDEIYQSLEKTLKYHRAIHSVGDEGGFAPNLFTNLDALEIIVEAINNSEHKFAQDALLGLDVAASWFFKNNKYTIKDRAQPYSRNDLIDYYAQLNKEYRLFSIEDPLEQDDWEGWGKITEELQADTIIVGDDLLTTNKHRVQKAIQKKACNAILVKPNQIGTISETIEVINICRQAGWKIIVSHRSGETNDTFIADFAVGVGADLTKFGAPARGERVAKYNRLLKIEQEIKS